jgi:hypothetical protein
MTKFLYGSEINSCIDRLIAEAETFLYLVSPFIKLHTRIKDELKKQQSNPRLEIVLMFGKNEHDPAKSLSAADIEFLKEMPNIKICYIPNLHAKYYASEKSALVTSMNLHQFSQNENVEIGIQMSHKSRAELLVGELLAVETDCAEIGLEYIRDKIKESEIIFHKIPEYSTRFLSEKYTGSRIEEDNTEQIFFTAKPTLYNRPIKSIVDSNSESISNNHSKTGFCIRTGVKIPFDKSKPMTAEALRLWSQFGNLAYQEKYCHYSGEPSNGATSFSRPILGKYWNEANRAV